MGHWCLEPDDYSYIVIIRSLQNNSELTILTFMTALISLHSNIKPLSFYCGGKPPEDLLTLLIVANKFIKIAGTLHSQMLIISDSQHWQSSWEEFTANQNWKWTQCFPLKHAPCQTIIQMIQIPFLSTVRIQWFWIYCKKSFRKEAKHVCKKRLWFRKHELVWGQTGEVSLAVCRRWNGKFLTLSLKEIGNRLQILTIVLVNNTDVFCQSKLSSQWELSAASPAHTRDSFQLHGHLLLPLLSYMLLCSICIV